MSYKTWGTDIDQKSHAQMAKAMELPVAVAGALMPDAHLGYGLPIGGVLALDNAVCPYAVGVDIACRMKMSIFPFDADILDANFNRFCEILERDTYFGVGVQHKGDNRHDVMLKDWGVSPVTRDNKEKASKQLGTSGSGNHFVEFGLIEVWPTEDQYCISGGPFNLRLHGIKCGTYVALMSHSGSRGTGAAVCNHYSKLAKQKRPEFGDLAWLDLGTPEGDEYWAAMNLMGDYASANHDVIHREIGLSLGVRPMHSIENHHNFAWKETHGGREVIVHRKGATPAGKGAMGIIPGSMGTPAFVVEGLGQPESLCSASHGAGRLMSRTQAKKTFDRTAELEKLKAQGVTVLSCGADEVPGVYKDINRVMSYQTDLVKPTAVFHPRIVKMAPGSERAED